MTPPTQIFGENIRLADETVVLDNSGLQPERVLGKTREKPLRKFLTASHCV
jgi:hypothetical protein